MIKVVTETGSVYEIDFDEETVTRINEDSPMRKDGEVIRYTSINDITVGEPIRMILEGVNGSKGVVTARQTSHVTRIISESDK